MKPFPCHYCHKPTLRTVRDASKEIYACCKDCQDKINNDPSKRQVLTISSIYKDSATEPSL